MDIERIILVVCLTVFIVVGINATLYVALRRDDNVRQIDLFRKAWQRARNPWEPEDKALEELSRLASQLRGDKTGDEPVGDMGNKSSEEINGG